MSIEIKVPALPESIADATIVTWHKKPGESVKRDENLVDLETDKVVLEVPAPEDGVLSEIIEQEGATVTDGQLLAKFTTGAAAKSAATPVVETVEAQSLTASAKGAEPVASPSVRRMMNEHNVDAGSIQGTGKGGRITKEDVMQQSKPQSKGVSVAALSRSEERVPMSRLRKRVAERLLSAQQTTAMLTTFNEVNMQPVMDLRQKYKDLFEKKYDARLGFMSFFIKASVEALKRFPAVNASIDGDDIVYHNFFDIGVAISTDRGLVVPILKDADELSMAKIESSIIDFAKRGRDGKLGIDEMTGGTFSITNGGVFGSMLSTPILNPPQSAILGMHKIDQRAVVENGEIVIRPMMYLALSYDHRIVDGKEAISFLVTIKEMLEDPARLLLGV